MRGHDHHQGLEKPAGEEHRAGAAIPPVSDRSMSPGSAGRPGNADIDGAVNATVFGSFFYQGDICLPRGLWWSNWVAEDFFRNSRLAPSPDRRRSLNRSVMHCRADDIGQQRPRIDDLIDGSR
jgi:hypothetical protein